MGKTKLNIPMLAALILLFLTMLSIHLTSGLYARYTATAYATASARVAKFDVKGSIDKDSITVDCTQSATDAEVYTITVQNNSEVTIKYSMRVTLDQEPPGTALLVQRDIYDPNAATKVMKFSNIGQLNPGDTGTHTLSFAVGDWMVLTKEYSGQNFQWESGFNVEIIAEQVD